MASEALALNGVGKATRAFRTGLGWVLPLAVTGQLAIWLAALLEKWVPPSAGAPARVAISVLGAVVLLLIAGWVRIRAAAPRPARRERPPAEVLPFPVGLAGSLSEIPFDLVCQLLAGASKTGVLTIDLEGQFAKVFFENGQFVTARYLQWSDQEAFNALYRCASGRFVFQPGGVLLPEHLSRRTVTHLLLEAARVSDETSRWQALFREASEPAVKA